VNDANNPVSNNNTGQSIIENEQVRVTVDYEVVDLGDGNWSPLNITDANGNIGFVRSFQYLFLQTYTVKNIKTTGNLTNLELYGMLHSHAANEYGDCVHASYTAANYNDPLSGYTPYNSVHNVGNFKYDFAQWNNLAEAETAAMLTGLALVVRLNPMYMTAIFMKMDIHITILNLQKERTNIFKNVI
jgi:hypothetical protein